MGLSWVDPKNHVLDGVQIPRGMGNFEGCPALESIALYAAKKSITASRRHCCSRLQYCQLVGVTLRCPSVKNPPLIISQLTSIPRGHSIHIRRPWMRVVAVTALPHQNICVRTSLDWDSDDINGRSNLST